MARKARKDISTSACNAHTALLGGSSRTHGPRTPLMTSVRPRGPTGLQARSKGADRRRRLDLTRSFSFHGLRLCPTFLSVRARRVARDPKRARSERTWSRGGHFFRVPMDFVGATICEIFCITRSMCPPLRKLRLQVAHWHGKSNFVATDYSNNSRSVIRYIRGC